MKSYGIGEAVVNVHHFADKVRDFLREHDDFGMRLHISDESGMLLDTGGGVAAAADWLSGDEPVLLHNADIYTDVDFVEMQRVYEASGADATLLTSHKVRLRDPLKSCKLWTLYLPPAWGISPKIISNYCKPI